MKAAPKGAIAEKGCAPPGILSKAPGLHIAGKTLSGKGCLF